MHNLNYQNLKWALDKNEKFLKINVFREYGDNHTYLQILDDLILTLRQNQCKNIQEKFLMGDRIFDFMSGLSELDMGKYFLEKGYNVNFIPQKNPHKSLPDLYAYKKDTCIFVEVKRIIEDDYLQRLYTYLANNVNYSFPISIEVHLNQEMSELSLTRNSKDKKMKLVTSLLSQFESELLHREYEDNMNIVTDYGSITLKKWDWSYNRNMVTFGSILLPHVTNNMLIDKIKNDVIKKADSKAYIKKYHINKAIIIALVFENQFPIIPDVDICLEKALIGTKRNGIFNTKNMKHIAGVLGSFRDDFYYIQNPNSDIKIDDI